MMLVSPNFRRRSSRQGRAFTLIEVIVSLAMVAVVMPAIMYGISLASSTAGMARNRTQAATLVQQKLDELIALGPVDGESGIFEDFPQFTWEASMTNDFNSPTVDNLTTSIQQFNVTVTWKQEGQPIKVVLSTLLYTSAAATAANGGLP